MVYAQIASAKRWSVRTLREHIDSMLYERKALQGIFAGLWGYPEIRRKTRSLNSV